MPSSKKYAVAPPEEQGFRIFVRHAYPVRYNFAVDNYNAVSARHKRRMFGGFVILYRSVTAACWITAMVFGVLALLYGKLVIADVIISAIYLAISIYNFYVYMDNRSLVIGTRLLRAKAAGPSGLNHEWVSVPLDSRSANERLANVDQMALDSVRREFAGQGQGEIDCLVYTQRYADTYASFPKEVLLHMLAFLVALALGIGLALV